MSQQDIHIADSNTFLPQHALQHLLKDGKKANHNVGGMGIVPMAVETFGGWGQRAMSTIAHLSTLLAAQSGTRQADELRCMYQRHCIALQRDNARMILEFRAVSCRSDIPI